MLRRFSKSIRFNNQEFTMVYLKMIKEGIDRKIFKVLKSFYSDIKLCVKHMNSVSDFLPVILVFCKERSHPQFSFLCL